MKSSASSRPRRTRHPLSERFYNRLWENHFKPLMDSATETRPLMVMVDDLPDSMVPENGRSALYQAMARRARGETKGWERTQVSEEGTPA